MKKLNSISIFVFEEKTELNIVLLDGEPWFIAVEVCKILELTNPTESLRGLDNDEKLTSEILRAGQKRKVNLINESGLYTLIMRSTKPQAKVFRKWVTSEVLPQIRKTGAYQNNPKAENLNWEQIFAVLDERYAQIEAVSEFSQKTAQHLKRLYEQLADLQNQTSTPTSNDYVYVFHNQQSNEYKIGKSSGVPVRQKAMQLVEPNIYVYLLIPMQSNRHAHLWERTLQAEFESKRVHGEWFKLGESDLTMLRLMAKIMHLGV